MSIKAWKRELVSKRHKELNSLGFVTTQDKTMLVIHSGEFRVIYYPVGNWWSCRSPIGQGRGYGELIVALNNAKIHSELVDKS
tara:strand:+ start:889 stop:1137 length:249 start_codon:yes stop_codon:yes gene_type:complete